MNNKQPGMPGSVEATAAMIVFVCILGGMWILLFKAAIVLLGAIPRF
jgi:hypothetical protein